MFIAKNEDLIILAKDTREELEQALEFMVYTSVEETEEEYVLYDGAYILKDELATKRKEQFNKEFFNTSLGYIRRLVTMKDGSKKAFLTDLLPTMAIGVQAGLDVYVIAYNEPDFTQEVINWEELQHVEKANMQFIQECMTQLNNDFGV